MEQQRKGVAIDVFLTGAAMVAASAIVLWLTRHPDAARTANMRACLAIKRAAQRSADALQKLADDAGTQYNSLRLTA